MRRGVTWLGYPGSNWPSRAVGQPDPAPNGIGRVRMRPVGATPSGTNSSAGACLFRIAALWRPAISKFGLPGSRGAGLDFVNWTGKDDLRLEISPASVSVVQMHEWGARVLCLNQTGERPA